MPPRKREIPADANPELEEDGRELGIEGGDANPGEDAIAVVETPPGAKWRTLKYLGKEPNWKCFATSPPLTFANRICDQVPESVAKVLVKNKKKTGLPLFKDITPGAEALTNPETEGQIDVDDTDLFGD